MKEEILRVGMTTWSFDIFGFAETNLDWRLLPEEQHLFQRTKGWWDSLHISLSHNTTSAPNTVWQFGGTALFSFDKAAHRIIERGQDPARLGRWCWSRFRGKSQHTLRVVTAYHPNPPGGPFTVYAQHASYFNSVGDNWCPRLAFLQDLERGLQSFLLDGDQIVLV